jgi:hypothetical protein
MCVATYASVYIYRAHGVACGLEALDVQLARADVC